jgi:Tc5 transposase DNA-binding domain
MNQCVLPSTGMCTSSIWLIHDNNIGKQRPSKFPQIEELLREWLIETRASNIALSDALIRQKAKDTARSLDISEEKFKASSGWVENFKHRHGIRGGVWHGDGKDTRHARTVEAEAGAVDQTAIDMSRMNPEIMMSNGDSHYGGNMDINTGSHNMMAPPRNSALNPPWQCPDGPTSANVSIPSGTLNRPHISAMHDPTSHSNSVYQHHRHTYDHQPHHDSTMQLDHMAVSANDHPHEHNHQPGMHNEPHPPTTYSAGMYPTIPTLSEVEEAIDKVIRYACSTGKDTLAEQDRQSLRHIRGAITRAASGITYERG